MCGIEYLLLLFFLFYIKIYIILINRVRFKLDASFMDSDEMDVRFGFGSHSNLDIRIWFEFGCRTHSYLLTYVSTQHMLPQEKYTKENIHMSSH